VKTLLTDAINADWINDNGRCIIRYITSNKEIKVYKPETLSYMFIKKADKTAVLELLKHKYDFNIDTFDETGYYIDCQGNDCIKLEVNLPIEIYDRKNPLNSVRGILDANNIISYEADIKFVNRLLIDREIISSTTHYPCAFDLEVDARVGFPDADDPIQRLTAISVVGYDGKEYFFSDTDELKMLKEFQDLINNKYTVLCGYNCDKFDLPYLINRCHRIGFNLDLFPIQTLDLLKVYAASRPEGRPSSLRLDDVSKLELGIGKKEDFTMSKKMLELWDAFIDYITYKTPRFKDYSIQDSRLVKMLDEKLWLSTLKFKIAEYANLFVSDVAYVGKAVEALLLYKAQQKKPRIVFFNRKPGKKMKEAKYRGALIEATEIGLHKNVFSVDFISLYNRIIQTFNEGIDTISSDKNGIKTEKLVFKENPRSLFAETLEELEVYRNEAKEKRNKYPKGSFEYKAYDSLQVGIKVLLLSFYGTSGDETSRVYYKDVAESVTLTGQAILKAATEIVEKDLGLKVIRRHTDSIYCCFTNSQYDDLQFIKNNIYRITKYINVKLEKYLKEKYNIPDKYYKIQLAPQNIFKYVYLSPKGDTDEASKTNLFGKSIWEEGTEREEDKIIGVLHKRYDVIPLQKEVKQKIYNIFSQYSTEEEIFSSIRDYLKNLKKDLFNSVLDDKLVFTKMVRKKVTEYMADQPHVRAAKIMDEKNLFRDGDYIKYVVTNYDDKQVIEPYIDNKMPVIKRKGYEYYWESIQALIYKILGKDIYTKTLDEEIQSLTAEVLTKFM